MRAIDVSNCGFCLSARACTYEEAYEKSAGDCCRAALGVRWSMFSISFSGLVPVGDSGLCCRRRFGDVVRCILRLEYDDIDIGMR